MVLFRGLKQEPAEWLDSIDEETYRTWEAYSRLEPWWGHRELLAKLLATQRCLLAGKYEEDKVSGVLKNVDDVAAGYMPGDWVDQPEPVDPEKAIRDVEKQLAARFG